MDSLIYDLLLIVMMIALYKAGVSLRKNGKIISPAGITAIIIYTLNEGLRFGRGVDYNIYGMNYEKLEKGVDVYKWDAMFKGIAEVFISLNIPWQGYVMFMSFVFIIATLILLRIYRDVLPYSLPLFVLFSMGSTENMVRWYFAFSFIMIGLSKLLDEQTSRRILKYFLFSAFACTIHLAIAPVPVVFYLLKYRKIPLLSPLYVLLLYFGIVFFFQTEFMLRFVELVNMLSMVSEQFEGYGYKAEYWLTGGYAGTTEHSGFAGIADTLSYCTTVICWHNIRKEKKHIYVYTYNLFIIGLLLNPIGRQIELVSRYDQVFFFFRALVAAYVLGSYTTQKNMKHNIFFILFLLSILNTGRRTLMEPIKNPNHYLYVWNKKRMTYQKMLDMWFFDAYEVDRKKRKSKLNQ